jgi:hypothetical protein
MKSFLFVLALTFTHSAFAQMGAPVLTLNSNLGTVAPAYQVMKSCEIYAGTDAMPDGIVVLTVKSKAGTTVSKMPVTFTEDLVDFNAVDTAITTASRAEIVAMGIPPVGGPSSYYLAGRNNLMSKAGSLIYLKNPTEEATSLVELLDLNCNRPAPGPAPQAPHPAPADGVSGNN